jgi:predicted dehydrogenase
MSTLRVAIVGCGRISELHELGYRDFKGARIVAVCDKNRRLAEEKARLWNVKAVYTDYEQILASNEIDLIELLVPHHLHAPMTIAACRAGKHVSVQKPMALSLTEADAMIGAAKGSGVFLRVFENFVFYPPFVKAKSMIDNGIIGELQMIRLHFNSGTLDTSWKVPLKSWLWRFDQKKCGGGPLTFDHGFHLFSIAHFLMGPVERVCAWIDRTPIVMTKFVDGPATIMLKFKDPRKYGVMDFSHTPQIRINSLYYADDNRIEIIGDRGIIFVNQCTTKTIDLPAMMLYKDGKTKKIDVDRTDWKYSFFDCTRHFVDAIASGRPPLLDGQAARAVLQTTLAAQYSAIERREFDVEEVAHYGEEIGVL